MNQGWSEAKRELKAKASLADQLARIGVKPSRNGHAGHFTGICPWHGDKDASLHVYPDGHFHCFGCGCRGDVIDAFAYAEGLASGSPPYTDLGEAIRRLALQTGVQLPSVSKEWIEREAQRRESSRLYSDCARQAVEWLWDDFVGEDAQEYLKRRGFSEETVRTWGLGFWPNGTSSRVLADEGGDAVPQDARRPYTFQQLRDAGLRATTRDDREYDVLAGCIVFPIEAGGHVSYLTGRTVPTPTREKRHVKLTNVDDGAGGVRNPCPALIGLHRLPRGAKRVLLVEGETDTITLDQAGIPAVGRLGVSAKRADVVQILERFDEVVIAFDADPPRENGQEPASLTETRALAAALVNRARVLRVEYPARPDGTRPKDPNGYLQDLVASTGDVKTATAQLRTFLLPRIDAAPRALDWLLDQICLDADPVVRARRVGAEIVPLMVEAGKAERDAMVTVVAAKTSLTKGSVREALEEALRAKAHEEKAKADPDRPSDGLVAGTYYSSNGRMYWVSSGREGPRPVQIANFEARITEQILMDDGGDDDQPARWFSVEGRMHDGRQLPVATVPAKSFGAMSWLAEAWGAGPSITAGTGMRDHARACIEQLSGTVPERRRFRHTGWRNLGGRWVYLHAGGGIGANGPEPGIDVGLDAAFRHYKLPDPPSGPELVTAIRTYFEMLEVAPIPVVAPLFCSTWRTPLGGTDFSIFVVGKGGRGKSCLAALFQNAWGAAWNFEKFPANWSSTANMLEAQAFATKDVGIVIDDYAPTSARGDREKYAEKADRIFRAVGNQAGRGRLNYDSTQKATKWPRGQVIATGEDVPDGLGSMLARMLVVRVPPDAVRMVSLTRAQAAASSGVYASVMAAYVRWLAPRMDEIRSSLRGRRDQIAATWAETMVHRRTPRIVADLCVGLEEFLNFALEAGAITSDQWKAQWKAITDGLLATASDQTENMVARDAERRFIELIQTALGSGRAHLATVEGHVPRADIANACGWRRKLQGTGYGRMPEEEWQCMGQRIGWLDGGNLYLDPTGAYAVAQEIGRQTNDGLAVSQRTLGRRLKEADVLLSTDLTRETVTIRRVCEGLTRGVYHLQWDRLVNGNVGSVGSESGVAEQSDMFKGE